MREDEFETILVYISLIALLFQFYVLYLIQTKSHGGMQNYKYFLNSTVIWDMLFTFLYGIAFRATPVFWIFSVCGLAHYLGHMGTVVTFGLLFYCASNLLLSQLYSLIYRYTLLHDNPQVYKTFVSLKSKMLNLILTQCFSVGIGVVAPQTLTRAEILRLNWISNVISSAPDTHTEGHLYFVNGSLVVTRLYFFFIGVAVFIGSLVSLWLIWQIFALLRRNSDKLTKQTCSLHVQYTVLLLLQILSLLLFLAFPMVLYICRGTAWNLSIAEQFQIGLIILGLCAPLNSVLPLLCITSYRQHAPDVVQSLYRQLSNLIRCKHKRQRVGSAVCTVPTIVHKLPNMSKVVE